MVISITLVFSTCPPVSVLVRARAISLEAFLGGLASGTRRLIASWHRTSGYAASDLPEATPTCLPQDDHRLGFLSLPRPPIGQLTATWYRNINLLAIDYAFRPRLRSRLTLSRRTLLRNPWQSVEGILTPLSLLMPAFSLPNPPRLASAAASLEMGTLSYRVIREDHTRSFGD